jgi:hypothetical protein
LPRAPSHLDQAQTLVNGARFDPDIASQMVAQMIEIVATSTKHPRPPEVSQQPDCRQTSHRGDSANNYP